MTPSTTLDAFANLSAALTGFDAAQLIGTGNAELFWDLLVARAGPANAEALLTVWTEQVEAEAHRDRAIRIAILSDRRYGPMARNLIRLWYVGTWKQLPADWRGAYAPTLADGDIIPAPQAYTEGLLWPAVGANPPGAKPFGYAMWAKPPRVTLDSKDTPHA
ncbi:hypothetical protein [Roseisalinus antarcticus]|uniref:Membrane bound FAD containing D-sorbitol dehydrogenase n=1 Tax=Roseisalinus antarcticus TaxID=254357 RepID=A0A1Y5SZB5_9RHOB|nr:hypothetical protein [Roseisalinus antarcticus]SLN52169.1 hypothetical protein ROA7023_02305 [Roseisalinus antarcticus]